MGPFAVDGLAQRVDDAAQEAVAHRDAGALAAAGDHGAHADGLSAVEEHDAQTARLHALHHALCAVLKGDDLAVDRRGPCHPPSTMPSAEEMTTPPSALVAAGL